MDTLVCMRIRRANERGFTDLGWLKSRHSFSFGDYYDPRHVGFKSLRVINDDWVEAGEGFGMHGHRDMEILTLVLRGELEHQDSLGHKQVLRPGEVQVMSAGRGIRHSERNPSATEPAHFLQIWIEPHTLGVAPRYEQRAFPLQACQNSWCALASSCARDSGSFEIHQNTTVLYGAVLDGGTLEHAVRVGESAWLHVIDGEVRINECTLRSGDAASVEEVCVLECRGISEKSSLLLFAFHE